MNKKDPKKNNSVKKVTASVGSDETSDLSPKVLALMIGIIGLVYGYWLMQTTRPYDDDNIGRYFMAQASLTKPEFFLNMWGRPLAILFFSLPSQVSFLFCQIMILFVTLATLYYTYRVAQSQKVPNAWMVILFLAFQPVFFSTSYSLCAEPLAAFLLALGLYYYLGKKQLLIGAIILSFMPLARTEMVFLLPIFAIDLLRERRYLTILALGTGLVLLQLFGMVFLNDFLFLLTVTKGVSTGMYQNIPFEHYFQRFVFVVGPVVFVLMMLTLTVEIKNKTISLISLAVVLMFIVHVLAAWKGNGASIGFVRHFTAFAPAIALMAVSGFNIVFSQKNENDFFFKLIVLIGCTFVILIFYSFELIGDYFISNTKEYMKTLIAMMLLVLFVLQNKLNFNGRLFFRFVAVLVMGSLVVYTLVKEPPMQLAPEHHAVKSCYQYYEANLKSKNNKTMVAHPWFFFFDNYNSYIVQPNEGVYFDMRKEKLNDLPVGAFVLWDSHYSWRLSCNVQQEDLVNNPNFRLQQQFVSTDRRFAMYVFEKIKA